jgi:ribosomal protein S18 acetylase RimI-like enzyme
MDDSPNAVPPTVTIREFREEDWDAVCLIHDSARPHELAGSCDPRAFVPIEQDAEVADLRRCRKFVASQDDKVVGFVGIDKDYLAWLYVDPAHFGRGIGRELLRMGVREIGEGAWTKVLMGNKRAIALYESEGFRATGRFAGNNAGYPCSVMKMMRDQ